MNSRSLLIIVVLVAVATALMLPILVSPTFAYGPDAAMHIFNTHEYAMALRQGILYPRWLGDWYGGYGAPVGVVYQPFTYYVGALLHLVGLPVITAIKLVLWLSTVLSGLWAYRLVARFATTFPAVVGAMLFQLVPYRALDLYGRTALPEYVAFMWMPLIAWCLIGCIAAERASLKFGIGLALGVAGLLFTHLLVGVLFLALLMGWAVLLLSQRHIRTLWCFLRVAGALGLGAALAAIYWLPALVESQWLNTVWLQNLQPGVLPAKQEWGNYLNNFLFGAQAYVGTRMAHLHTENVRNGYGAVLSLVAGFVALIVCANHWQKMQMNVRVGVVGAGLMWAASLFMSFDISAPVWRLLPRLHIVQFPWRFQAVTAFAEALLMGLAADAVRLYLRLPKTVGQWAVAGLGGALCAYSVFLAVVYHSRVPAHVAGQISGQAPLAPENFDWVFDDLYIPRANVGFNYAAHAITPGQPPITSESGAAQIKVEQWHFQSRVISVTSVAKNRLRVPGFWFAGWQARVNDVLTPIDLDAADGMMLIAIPSGQSHIQLEFVDTPPRQWGAWVSAVACAVFVILLAVGFSRRAG